MDTKPIQAVAPEIYTVRLLPRRGTDEKRLPKVIRGVRPIGSIDDRTPPEAYCMTNDIVEIRVRRAFLFYTLMRLGLATDPAARLLYDQEIILLNRDTVRAVLTGQLDGARV